MTEPMFARVGIFEIRPGTFDALRHRYAAECAPAVRAAEGSVDCFVLESADSATEVAICTVWRTEADAIAYEASGQAAEMVGRVREFFAGRPALTSYRVHHGAARQPDVDRAAAP
jgi:heme-degrading monooxygenase HmoA